MTSKRAVPLMLSIPKEYRDQLRRLAARQNVKDPDQVTSASTIARHILCESLDRMNLRTKEPNDE